MTFYGNTVLKTTKISAKNGGERLDVFLAANLEGLTRSAAQKLIEAGRVTLGGSPVRKNHPTSPGEEFTVTQDEPEEPTAVPQDIPLDVVFEDSDIIVVNKPRGMVVHPAPGHPDGTLVNALLSHCGESLSGIGGVKRPGIVHRIDKDTSGLVIAAKNDRAHLALAAQLSARTLTREYDAVVRGVISSLKGKSAGYRKKPYNAGVVSPMTQNMTGKPYSNETGTIDAPIGRHPTDRKRQAVTDKNSRPAITRYEVVAEYNGYTHVRCRLETGRTHQIRVHMAYIGHPVLGDVVYGRKKPELGLSGQCLHARKLKFLHPTTGEHIEIGTDLPEYFRDVLSKLELKYKV